MYKMVPIIALRSVVKKYKMVYETKGHVRVMHAIHPVPNAILPCHSRPFLVSLSIIPLIRQGMLSPLSPCIRYNDYQDQMHQFPPLVVLHSPWHGRDRSQQTRFTLPLILGRSFERLVREILKGRTIRGTGRCIQGKSKQEVSEDRLYFWFIVWCQAKLWWWLMVILEWPFKSHISLFWCKRLSSCASTYVN